MANNEDRAYGFKPWGPLLTRLPFDIRGNNNHPAFIGDVMSMETDGYVTACAGGATNIIGVNLTFVTGGVTKADLNVTADPMQLYQAQHDGTHALANNGATVDHIYAFGSFNTKLSGSEIDTSEIGVGASGFVHLKLVNRPDNAIGANADVIVGHAGAEHLRLTGTGF